MDITADQAGACDESATEPDARGHAARERFESLYTENYESILGYARRRTVTREDATEVVADTFLTAWRRLADVPPGSQGRLWLFGVARHVLYNQQRTRNRMERLHARLAGHTEVATGDDHGMHPPGAISAAFASLTPDDRDLLTLVAVEGLRPGEIAVVLRQNSTRVRVRLHRARARFARALADRGVTI